MACWQAMTCLQENGFQRYRKPDRRRRWADRRISVVAEVSLIFKSQRDGWSTPPPWQFAVASGRGEEREEFCPVGEWRRPAGSQRRVKSPTDSRPVRPPVSRRWSRDTHCPAINHSDDVWRREWEELRESERVYAASYHDHHSDGRALTRRSTADLPRHGGPPRARAQVGSCGHRANESTLNTVRHSRLISDVSVPVRGTSSLPQIPPFTSHYFQSQFHFELPSILWSKTFKKFKDSIK